MQRWHVLDTAREEPGGQRGNRGVPHILAEYGKVPLLNSKVPFCIIILCRNFQCKIKTRMIFVIKALNKDGCQYCFYQLCLIRGQNLLSSVTSILIKRGHFWPAPPPHFLDDSYVPEFQRLILMTACIDVLMQQVS